MGLLFVVLSMNCVVKNGGQTGSSFDCAASSQLGTGLKAGKDYIVMRVGLLEQLSNGLVGCRCDGDGRLSLPIADIGFGESLHAGFNN